MNNKELDIVNLIEQNPITKLTGNYQTVFINKIKQIFNENEQKITRVTFGEFVFTHNSYAFKIKNNYVNCLHSYYGRRN